MKIVEIILKEIGRIAKSSTSGASRKPGKAI
jgi:hypothetical protein